LKLYSAKQSISVGSEGIEAFGAQGYIEETGIPNLLRDAQVLLFKFIQIVLN
jgi:putative acyl-CoA dehydrogenase